MLARMVVPYFRSEHHSPPKLVLLNFRISAKFYSKTDVFGQKVFFLLENMTASPVSQFCPLIWAIFKITILLDIPRILKILETKIHILECASSCVVSCELE